MIVHECTVVNSVLYVKALVVLIILVIKQQQKTS